jgi:hypothetical protein
MVTAQLPRQVVLPMGLQDPTPRPAYLAPFLASLWSGRDCIISRRIEHVNMLGKVLQPLILDQLNEFIIAD